MHNNRSHLFVIELSRAYGLTLDYLSMPGLNLFRWEYYRCICLAFIHLIFNNRMMVLINILIAFSIVIEVIVFDNIFFFRFINVMNILLSKASIDVRYVIVWMRNKDGVAASKTKYSSFYMTKEKFRVKLIEIVIVWVYYTIPFGFSLFMALFCITFNFY